MNELNAAHYEDEVFEFHRKWYYNLNGYRVGPFDTEQAAEECKKKQPLQQCVGSSCGE